MGGRQGASCSAKNCIDTRGGRAEWGTEGRGEGGGRGGLSCGSGGAVSVSETGPSRNQPVSVSERAAGEWRRLRSRVYHTASVYVRASMRAGDFILPEAGERSGHTPPKIFFCHSGAGMACSSHDDDDGDDDGVERKWRTLWHAGVRKSD